MKTIQIKKKSGGVRTVYVPEDSHKAYLRSILPRLNSLQTNFLDWHEHHLLHTMRGLWNSSRNSVQMPFVHGFLPGLSPVSNAFVHSDYSYTLSVDIKDCFDSTNQAAVEEGCLANQQMLRFLVDQRWAIFEHGAARQGLPTSPALANVALAAVDRAVLMNSVRMWRDRLPSIWYRDVVNERGIAYDIHDFLNRSAASRVPNESDHTWAYTRYADDITVSANSEEFIRSVMTSIQDWVSGTYFQINPKKTRLQMARFGKRIITGIAVDTEIASSRSTRRKLRAAQHQGNISAANGLSEWIRLKLPAKLSPTD